MHAMTFTWTRIVVCCSLLAFACCQGETRPDADEPVEEDYGLHRLVIRNTPVYVEIADNSASRSFGLKQRESLPEDHGMLFVYRDLDIRSFWMKDTRIKLSLAYIDEQGRIFQFVDMEPLSETSHYSEKPVQYVLEVNQGWFAKHGIQTGDRVENLPSVEAIPEGAGW